MVFLPPPSNRIVKIFVERIDEEIAAGGVDAVDFGLNLKPDKNYALLQLQTANRNRPYGQVTVQWLGTDGDGYSILNMRQCFTHQGDAAHGECAFSGFKIASKVKDIRVLFIGATKGDSLETHCMVAELN